MAIHAVTADVIDRMAPMHRPPGRVAMRQSWHDLLFLHWEAPAAQIRPLIPPELDLDLFEGRAFVALVPFTMTGVRPIWAPSFPPLTDFHETNVRTYVHHRGANPGVWFFSLDAANSLAVRVARAFWKLPYHFARIRLERAECDNSGQGPAGEQLKARTISYSLLRLWPGPLPARCGVTCSPLGQSATAVPGTLEHFLAERYLLYTRNNRTIYRAQVHHSPYPLQSADVTACEENLIAAAGITRNDGPPLAHYARGVSVDVYPLKPLRT